MSDPRAHNYEYPVDLNSDSAAAKVIRYVGEGKKVLEIGAGPGSITKILTNEMNCDVVGLEIDPTAIEILKTRCKKVYSLDLNRPGWAKEIRDSPFDVVIIPDVLEHLYEPARVLSEVRSVLSSDGYVVVSLPHAGHSAVIASLINGNFEYRDWGLLDKTHIRFFCIANMAKIFEECGFLLQSYAFVERRPEDTELAHHFLALPRVLRLALASRKHADVYQVVSRIAPVEQGGGICFELPATSQISGGIPKSTPLARRWKKFRRAIGLTRTRKVAKT